jgi:hypothetical protein
VWRSLAGSARCAVPDASRARVLAPLNTCARAQAASPNADRMTALEVALNKDLLHSMVLNRHNKPGLLG